MSRSTRQLLNQKPEINKALATGIAEAINNPIYNLTKDDDNSETRLKQTAWIAFQVCEALSNAYKNIDEAAFIARCLKYHAPDTVTLPDS